MTLDEWITFFFDRPITKPEWFWDSNIAWDILPQDDAVTVAYLTQNV